MCSPTSACGGNPLAVFPDARGLGDAQMQALANEFNFSETTFVLPPDKQENTARVRFSTKFREMPFAGHPNVGTGNGCGVAATGVCCAKNHNDRIAVA